MLLLQLIAKLRRFGIKGNSLDWFSNYLYDRTHAVRIGNTLSNLLTIQSAVPQGSILGPVLFALYSKDLPSRIQFSSTMMYADDTAIYFTSSNLSELVLKLNLELVNLS